MNLIRIAESDQEIAACFAVMHELRTHLIASEFVARVRRQQAEGYRLAFIAEAGEVRAVAGYRRMENLVSGCLLYVDDLVTTTRERSKGHGRALLSWLIERARADGCAFLELDSGVQRFDAHRFYMTHRLVISAHHFRLKL